MHGSDIKKKGKMKYVIIGIFLLSALGISMFLIFTGKIDLKSIMGNTAQGEYTCPKGMGYKLDGKVCVKEARYTPTTLSYSCPTEKGYKKYGTTQCRKVTGYTYSCPNGYKLNTSTTCKKKTSPYNVIGATKTTKYSTINATKTEKYSTINATNTTQYSIINATKTEQYSTINATKTTQYSTINATKTTQYSTINATKEYTCAPNYEYDSTKNECYATVKVPATKKDSINVGSFTFKSSSYTLEMDKTFGTEYVTFIAKTESGLSLSDVTGNCSVSNPNVIAVDHFNEAFLPKGAASMTGQVWLKTIAPGTSTLTCTLTTGHTATTTITK